MELELKHLSPYLPYGLKCQGNFNKPCELLGLRNGSESVSNEMWIFKHGNKYYHGYLYECKPILRPLSDLTKEVIIDCKLTIPVNEMLDEYIIREIPKHFDYKMLRHGDIEKLFKWHFDVFRLIEKGLAIDINTLNKK